MKQAKSELKIAVIGGIGSGKSEAAKYLAEKLSYRYLSADIINRELLFDGRYLKKLEKAFPEAFRAGVLDTAALSEVVFNDGSRRERLNALAHPEITKRLKSRLKDKGGAVVEIPLYLESGLRGVFDKVILITAEEGVKISRIAARSKLSESEIFARIAAQKSDAELASYADTVIDNSAPLAALHAKLSEISELIKTENN